MSAGASGLDVFASFSEGKPVTRCRAGGMGHTDPTFPWGDAPAGSTYITLQPGDRYLIPLGFAVAVPEGFEVQVRSRSGATFKRGLVIANSPGTVDSDYRGEVCAIVMNVGDVPRTVYRGEAVAQIVVCPVMVWAPVLVDSVAELGETARGGGGFGSTDLRRPR
jgi:dUTP pyrophosphatase